MLVVVALLVAVLLAVIGALVWQEARSRGTHDAPVYVVEDAVGHIMEGLAPDSELRTSDVRRIVEWEVYQLQGLAQPSRRRPVDVIAGGTDQTVSYIVDQIAERHGVTYAPVQVAEVLALEAEYLQSIGAVGGPVSEVRRYDGTQPEPGGDGR